jgi:hypothetical protein
VKVGCEEVTPATPISERRGRNCQMGSHEGERVFQADSKDEAMQQSPGKY